MRADVFNGDGPGDGLAGLVNVLVSSLDDAQDGGVVNGGGIDGAQVLDIDDICCCLSCDGDAHCRSGTDLLIGIAVIRGNCGCSVRLTFDDCLKSRGLTIQNGLTGVDVIGVVQVIDSYRSLNRNGGSIDGAQILDIDDIGRCLSCDDDAHCRSDADLLIGIAVIRGNCGCSVGLTLNGCLGSSGAAVLNSLASVDVIGVVLVVNRHGCFDGLGLGGSLSLSGFRLSDFRLGYFGLGLFGLGFNGKGLTGGGVVQCCDVDRDNRIVVLCGLRVGTGNRVGSHGVTAFGDLKTLGDADVVCNIHRTTLVAGIPVHDGSAHGNAVGIDASNQPAHVTVGTLTGCSHAAIDDDLIPFIAITVIIARSAVATVVSCECGGCECADAQGQCQQNSQQSLHSLCHNFNLL